jgi:hypothetical protein
VAQNVSLSSTEFLEFFSFFAATNAYRFALRLSAETGSVKTLYLLIKIGKSSNFSKNWRYVSSVIKKVLELAVCIKRHKKSSGSSRATQFHNYEIKKQNKKNNIF